MQNSINVANMCYMDMESLGCCENHVLKFCMLKIKLAKWRYGSLLVLVLNLWNSKLGIVNESRDTQSKIPLIELIIYIMR